MGWPWWPSSISVPTGSGRSARKSRTVASEPLLRVSGLTKRFGGLLAINDVSFSVASGAVHGLIGPNGAGKTSIFNCLTSFVAPTAGTIAMDGERIDGLAPHRIAAHGIARTYQNVRLFPDPTAHDNVLVGRHRKVRAAVWEVVARTTSFPPRGGGALCRRRRASRLRRLVEKGDRSPATCPMAISAGWRSPARWPPIPGCCCSTSRPPA